MSDPRPEPEPGDAVPDERAVPPRLHRQGMEPDGAEARIADRLDREHAQDERPFGGRIL